MTRNRSRLSRPLAAALLAALLAPVAMSQADVAMPNPPEFPIENPLLPDQDILGKFLFWDEQMSHDNTMSCGTCHIHEAGGSDPRLAINPGPDGLFSTADDIHGSAGLIPQTTANEMEFVPSFGAGIQVTGRKAPSAINAVYHNDIFWDGRALTTFTDPQSGLVEIVFGGGLESQAAGPPNSSVEMSANGTDWNDVTAKIAISTPMALATNIPIEMQDFLADNPTYPDMFEAVYGDPAVTSKRLLFAIANYERTLIADETPLDDFLKGMTIDLGVFQPGFDLFQGSANCAICHVMPFTMDDDFHNIGVRPDAEDIGRQAVTGDPADIAKFKTPNIRNSALRLPLFHNGSINSITELVDFYNDATAFGLPNTDENFIALGLTDQDKLDLVDFIAVGMTDQRLVNKVFPFNRPTLRSELPSLNVVYGVASLDSVGGTATIFANGPANRGSQNFLIGMSDAQPNRPAVLALAFASDPLATPYPDPRFPIPMNLDIFSIFQMTAFVTSPDGIASFNMPIPNNAILVGFKFYAQWFVDEVGTQEYGTEGLEIQIL
jgi:cytochrome c peroxidase